MKMVVVLNKAKGRPVGHITPGGFIKTSKGWRKVTQKDLTQKKRSAEGVQKDSRGILERDIPTKAQSSLGASQIQDLPKEEIKYDMTLPTLVEKKEFSKRVASSSLGRVGKNYLKTVIKEKGFKEAVRWFDKWGEQTRTIAEHLESLKN